MLGWSLFHHTHDKLSDNVELVHVHNGSGVILHNKFLINVCEYLVLAFWTQWRPMSLSRGHHKLAHADYVVVVLTVSGLLASQTSRGPGWMNHFGGGGSSFCFVSFEIVF